MSILVRERRAAPRPCPSDPAACWLRAGHCSQCIPQFALDVADAIYEELERKHPQDAVLLARAAAIALVRRYGGEAVYVAGTIRLDRQQRDVDIRRMLQSGRSVGEVAQAAHLSQSQVRRIRQRRG